MCKCDLCVDNRSIRARIDGMTTEFKPTHRYLGGDRDVCAFDEGALVRRFADWHTMDGRTNGNYAAADGTVQSVFDDCMEAI